MAYLQLNFESQFLKNNHEVSIILPDNPSGVLPKDFYGGKQKYKVLWLLHGTFGDHSDWVRKSMIEIYAREKNLIVVMPSGMNANYANWPNFSIGYNMYDYLTEELMPLVYNWLPASNKREDNFIAGLSMGGRGTCVYAFNHPELFAGAAILSACPRDVDFIKENEPSMWARTMGSINNAGGLENYLSSYENTWRLVTELAPTGRLPKLYFACGMDDQLYPAFKHFRQHAEKIGLDASFEEVPGYKHEWRFWDLAIQRALEYFGIENADTQKNY